MRDVAQVAGFIRRCVPQPLSLDNGSEWRPHDKPRPGAYPDEIEFLPESNTTFFVRASDFGLRAQLEDEGRMIDLILIPGGKVAKKVH